MDRDQFEKGYAKAAGVTVDDLRARGLRAYPCVCNRDGCKGWSMLSIAAAELERAFGFITERPDA